MKKKAISKIPYHTTVPVQEKYDYIAVSFLSTIKKEQHLMIEIYENSKDNVSIPLLRMAYTEKDWCMYFPKQDIWSCAGIIDACGRYIWETGIWGHNTKDRTYLSEGYKENIGDFFKSINNCYYNKDWTTCLVSLEDSIKVMRRERQIQNRQLALKKRMDNTPRIPDGLEQWADHTLFGSRHFIYYKRRGRYCTLACSCCGRVTSVATRRLETFEGQFEKVMLPPKQNEVGRCPACGNIGIYKAEGNMHPSYRETSSFFVAQSYKGTGAVIRYFRAEKDYQIEEAAEAGHTIMAGASEQISIIEVTRTYIEQGKKPRTDFHKMDYKGKTFWDDCNLYGMGNIPIKEGAVYPKSYAFLKGTILQYSGAGEYNKHVHTYNMAAYMETYIRFPEIEMFVKAKMFGIVEELLHSRFGVLVNDKAQNPYDMLGIYKSRLKYLSNSQGDIKLLKILQWERRVGAHWTDKAVQFLMYTEADRNKIMLVTSHMSMTQLINRIEKYSGCSIADDGEPCSNMIARLHHITVTYLDYLMMRHERGYDLSNTIYLFPKDLEAAHRKMADETNKAQMDKRNEEVAGKYPNIRRDYRKLRKQYFYEDETYTIRPAMSAEEIVAEGRELHHCVGGDTYLERHDTGEAYILFLRFKNTPKIPYVTVEIDSSSGRIKQWYGAHDKKPDEENLQKWLDAYILRLKCNTGGMIQGTLMAAGQGLANMA